MHWMMNSSLMNISPNKMPTIMIIIIKLVTGGKKCKSMTNRAIKNFNKKKKWLVNTQANSNNSNKNNNNKNTINNFHTNHNNKGISIRKTIINNKELISIIMISIMNSMMQTN